MKKYTVYEHVSKDGKRYIGITSQDVKKRGTIYVFTLNKKKRILIGSVCFYNN